MHDIPEFAFEAAGPAAGYYYQLRYGLLRALQQIRIDPTGRISLERLDDVVIWDGGNPIELEQIKHSSKHSPKLSDMSPKIWRTFSNWLQLIDAGVIQLKNTSFVLVSNAEVATGSALDKLGPDYQTRQPKDALRALEDAALASNDRASAEDRQRFLSADPVVREALVGACTVVPGSANLEMIGTEIEEIIFYACDAEQVPQFRQALEGWWLHRVSIELQDGHSNPIPLIELDAQVSLLRERFKRSVLTIDAEIDTASSDEILDSVFVRQMRAVKASNDRLRNAQRDFWRAGAQRSKWLRDLKLDPAELNRYDAELEDQWSARAAIMLDELGVDAAENTKIVEGRRLLGWAETNQIPLRGAAAQFLTSGTFHTLADRLRIGWHPDFRTMFEVQNANPVKP